MASGSPAEPHSRSTFRDRRLLLQAELQCFDDAYMEARRCPSPRPLSCCWALFPSCFAASVFLVGLLSDDDAGAVPGGTSFSSGGIFCNTVTGSRHFRACTGSGWSEFRGDNRRGGTSAILPERQRRTQNRARPKVLMIGRVRNGVDCSSTSRATKDQRGRGRGSRRKDGGPVNSYSG